MSLFWKVLALSIATVGAAQAAAPEPALDTTPKPADASWLVGRWLGESIGGVTADMVFARPSGGDATVEYFREDHADGAPMLYEIILLRDGDEPLGLQVKHVKSDIAAMDGVDHPTEFNFIASGENELRLNDMLFKRVGNNDLELIIAPRNEIGLNQGETLRYTRAPN